MFLFGSLFPAYEFTAYYFLVPNTIIIFNRLSILALSVKPPLDGKHRLL